MTETTDALSYRLFVHYDGSGEFTGTWCDYDDLERARRDATVIRRKAALCRASRGGWQCEEHDLPDRNVVECGAVVGCAIYQRLEGE